MDRYLDRVLEAVAEEVPERAATISVTSPGYGASSAVNSGFVRLTLVPRDERERSQDEIAGALNARVQKLTGARGFVTQEPTIAVGRRRGLPVEFVLQAPNLGRLKEVLPRFVERAEAHPAFSFVDVDLVFDKPELLIDVDRARARDLGISALDVAQTLQLALAEQRLGYFVMDGKQYEVVGQVEREQRSETTDVRNLFIRTGNGDPVLLDKVIEVREQSSPPQLYHFDRYLSATVSADLSPGYTMGDGIAAMEEIAGETLDDTFATALSGQARDFAESARSVSFVFLLALLLVYLVLAGQFESFRDPLIIMLTVPWPWRARWAPWRSPARRSTCSPRSA